MTFSELKFQLKREGTLGTKIFYTVPKNLNDMPETFGDRFIDLPYEKSVEVTSNKRGKKILNFNNGFGGNADLVHFFFDRELADAYAVKIQIIIHDKLLKDLQDFENATKIKARLKEFTDKFPEYIL